MADRPKPAASVAAIVVNNSAWFNCRFWISGTTPDGKGYYSTNNSGNFQKDQRHTIGLKDCTPPIPVGSTVWPTVQAVLAGQPKADGNPPVRYEENKSTATYSVDGHEASWSVNLNQ